MLLHAYMNLLAPSSLNCLLSLLSSQVSTAFGDGVVLSRRVDSHADPLSTTEGGTEEVEVYEVKLIGWKLAANKPAAASSSASASSASASSSSPIAYLQGCDVRSKQNAATVAAVTAAASAVTSGNASSSSAAAGLHHWTQRLYKSSRLYRNANVLRSYQVALAMTMVATSDA